MNGWPEGVSEDQSKNKHRSRHLQTEGIARVKEIVITLFFFGDFGWVRHVGVAYDNRGVALLVFLYI